MVLNAALIVGLAHDSLLERVKSAKSVNVVMLLRVTCVGCGVDVGWCMWGLVGVCGKEREGKGRKGKGTAGVVLL